MISFCVKRVSTMIMVLILFSGHAFSLPLSRTCYTVPDGMIDVYPGEEFVRDRGTHRRDIVCFNLGLTDATSLGLSWSFLNYDLSGDDSEPGDAILELWHYTGRYLNEKLDTGISFTLRIPTGPDPSENEKWKNLSVGRSEVKISPVLSFRLTEKELLNMNLSYIFRAGHGENFYGALGGDLKKGDTYRSLFGLNPFCEDSFLSGDRLSDDYITTAFSIVESRLYPFVLYGELYHAFSDFRDDHDVPAGAVEGEGRSLTILSAGLKYFVRDSLFCNFYGTVNPFYTENELRWSAGAGINIFF